MPIENLTTDLSLIELRLAFDPFRLTLKTSAIDPLRAGLESKYVTCEVKTKTKTAGFSGFRIKERFNCGDGEW